MKYTLILLLCIPSLLFAQEKESENKRISFLIGTSQGVSFVHREAKSNTNLKTFDVTPGYAFSFGGGVNILSKSRKSFSEITLNYRSYGNGIKNIVDVSAANGYSSKLSYDRFNYLSLEYRYSRYVKTIKDYNTFFSLGMQASYILNEKKNLNYDDGSKLIKTKGKDFSGNDAITTTPTFLLSYGVEFDNGLFGIGRKSHLSLDFTYDWFLLGLSSNPSNQYFSSLINYKLIF